MRLLPMLSYGLLCAAAAPAEQQLAAWSKFARYGRHRLLKSKANPGQDHCSGAASNDCRTCGTTNAKPAQGYKLSNAAIVKLLQVR